MKILIGDSEMLERVIKAAKVLEEERARAISSICVFLEIIKKFVRSGRYTSALSSIIQISWTKMGLKSNQKIGILTAYSKQE